MAYLIGRKLVMDWGDKVVAIEILTKDTATYHMGESHALLFDIVNILDERVERFIGEPIEDPYGMSLNECMPSFNEAYWRTKKELL